MPPPVPPSVKAGRTMSGNSPMSSAWRSTPRAWCRCRRGAS
uniref:CARB n=1 Tax=Arundo donax TaxID=35708 RepID=A0A0A9F368_ARUDO